MNKKFLSAILFGALMVALKVKSKTWKQKSMLPTGLLL